jgi:CarboxypepD_reg-like domain/TonB-dependent Receptor Plug Domain
MKYYYIIFLLIWSFRLSAQPVITGQVLDERREPVLAASVYWSGDRAKNTATDMDGQFTLPIPARWPDTLKVRFFGYAEYALPLTQMPTAALQVGLRAASLNLDEVVIRSAAPILADFAATKLEPLDIWRNPVAAGDPLRAINALPASTNTQENANPALRGSDPEATLTVLNGVPVYQPTRNSQLNGVGNFSLFNTAILKNMTVYPGNPPLNYGNSAAGLIELETIDSVQEPATEWAVSLANVGGLLTRRIGRRAHAIAYGNWQFSEAFIGLNRRSLPFLEAFGARDAGLQLYTTLGSRTDLKVFSYLIDESFAVKAHSFGYTGQATGGRRRSFNLINLRTVWGNTVLRLDHGHNFSRSRYTFGAIEADNREPSTYTALSLQHFVGRNLTLQAGLTHDWLRFASRGTIPFFFYAPGNRTAVADYDTMVQRHNLEAYAVAKYLPGTRWSLSGGIRKNIPTAQQRSFWSGQLNARYTWGRGHSLLWSGGRYHYYPAATYFQTAYPLRRTDQVAVDYTFQAEHLRAAAALYAKRELGEQNTAAFIRSTRRAIYGAEMSAEWQPHRHWLLAVANTVVEVQERDAAGRTWAGETDMAWFVKAAIRFEHPRWVTATASWIGRPGERYTPIEGAEFQSFAAAWRPVFAAVPNSAQYPAYHNISLALSRYWPFRRGSIVAFASVNNLPNRRNPQRFTFSADYQTSNLQYYQLRTAYAGVVWRWQ